MPKDKPATVTHIKDAALTITPYEAVLEFKERLHAVQCITADTTAMRDALVAFLARFEQNAKADHEERMREVQARAESDRAAIAEQNAKAAAEEQAAKDAADDARIAARVAKELAKHGMTPSP